MSVSASYSKGLGYIKITKGICARLAKCCLCSSKNPTLTVFFLLTLYFHVGTTL